MKVHESFVPFCVRRIVRTELGGRDRLAKMVFKRVRPPPPFCHLLRLDTLSPLFSFHSLFATFLLSPLLSPSLFPPPPLSAAKPLQCHCMFMRKKVFPPSILVNLAPSPSSTEGGERVECAPKARTSTSREGRRRQARRREGGRATREQVHKSRTQNCCLWKRRRREGRTTKNRTCNNCVISASSAVVATLRSFFRKLPYRAVYCTPM